MQKSTMTLTIPQHALRDAAMAQAGLCPKALGMKPGTRVQRDRKASLKRGHVKHKGRCWD